MTRAYQPTTPQEFAVRATKLIVATALALASYYVSLMIAWQLGGGSDWAAGAGPLVVAWVPTTLAMAWLATRDLAWRISALIAWCTPALLAFYLVASIGS